MPVRHATSGSGASNGGSRERGSSPGISHVHAPAESPFQCGWNSAPLVLSKMRSLSVNGLRAQKVEWGEETLTSKLLGSTTAFQLVETHPGLEWLPLCVPLCLLMLREHICKVQSVPLATVVRSVSKSSPFRKTLLHRGEQRERIMR